MDIIDILFAKKLSSGASAVANATQAVATVNEILETTQNLENRAETVLSSASDALSAASIAQGQLEAALTQISSTTNNEIDKLVLAINTVTTSNLITNNLNIVYPSGKNEVISNVIKYYTVTGNNIDGTMTQKAITDAINQVSNNIPNINLGSNNSGKIVVVGSNGELTVGTHTESDINNSSGSSSEEVNLNSQEILGLEIDYREKTITRIGQAATLQAGSNFNKYPMFGGRMRCNVSDNGTINAFYGDNSYTENGSNGQVMVYQPKFYYRRDIISASQNTVGQIVNKEILYISDTKFNTFKIHPVFLDSEGNELDYVLFSAYEGSLYNSSTSTYSTGAAPSVNFYNDKLSSVAGVKPLTGANNNGFNIITAEKLATNRGNGWHITNMAAESANQMLEIIEFGTLNGQSALGLGISNISTVSNYNCASLTGSTSELGNTSGSAASTINEINGNLTTYTEDGKIAISYRGLENPWGNVWKFIGGCNIHGNGSQNGGVPYICTNFNYDINKNSDNYESIQFSIPSNNSWISAMGYGDEKYNWIYVPAEGSGGNAALPVGDMYWNSNNLNGTHMLIVGGAWSFGTSNGHFYYGSDRDGTHTSSNYGARLMFIPSKNSTYTQNYSKWLAKMGG